VIGYASALTLFDLPGWLSSWPLFVSLGAVGAVAALSYAWQARSAPMAAAVGVALAAVLLARLAPAFAWCSWLAPCAFLLAFVARANAAPKTTPKNE
jgi:hypothetical protein